MSNGPGACLKRVLAIAIISITAFIRSDAQSEIPRYSQFEIRGEDVVWENSYPIAGSADSIRRIVVQMLKSKFFTFNVIRNEAGYNGELRHYKVDCPKYGRTYFNTPRIYYEGEWTGKFMVDVFDGHYTVTVYALYFERMVKSTDYYRTERLVKGRYFDAVVTKNKSFRKSEFANLNLMGASLRDDFNTKNTIPIR
ncbi:MAG TPA: hypothetical protein PLR06_06205 [Cyclobacteriaceae bacterium]|nr:hypothetical protein [Cyclobacteriaceae bacterium]